MSTSVLHRALKTVPVVPPDRAASAPRFLSNDLLPPRSNIKEKEDSQSNRSKPNDGQRRSSTNEPPATIKNRRHQDSDSQEAGLQHRKRGEYPTRGVAQAHLRPNREIGVQECLHDITHVDRCEQANYTDHTEVDTE